MLGRTSLPLMNKHCHHRHASLTSQGWSVPPPVSAGLAGEENGGKNNIEGKKIGVKTQVFKASTHRTQQAGACKPQALRPSQSPRRPVPLSAPLQGNRASYPASKTQSWRCNPGVPAPADARGTASASSPGRQRGTRRSQHDQTKSSLGRPPTPKPRSPKQQVGGSKEDGNQCDPPLLGPGDDTPRPGSDDVPHARPAQLSPDHLPTPGDALTKQPGRAPGERRVRRKPPRPAASGGPGGDQGPRAAGLGPAIPRSDQLRGWENCPPRLPGPLPAARRRALRPEAARSSPPSPRSGVPKNQHRGCPTTPLCRRPGSSPARPTALAGAGGLLAGAAGLAPTQPAVGGEAWPRPRLRRGQPAPPRSGAGRSPRGVRRQARVRRRRDAGEPGPGAGGRGRGPYLVPPPHPAEEAPIPAPLRLLLLSYFLLPSPRLPAPHWLPEMPLAGRSPPACFSLARAAAAPKRPLHIG